MLSLGSLDFLGASQAEVQYALSPETLGVTVEDVERRVSGVGTQESGAGDPAQPGPGDNEPALYPLRGRQPALRKPPARPTGAGSRTSFPAVSEEQTGIRLTCQRGKGDKPSCDMAVLRPAFVAAIAPELRTRAGRLALVCPPRCAPARLLGANPRPHSSRSFALDMVITSHDPLRWNFSDSTDLSEVLLIATRRPDQDSGDARRTVFANLWQNPAGVLDAHRMAQSISQTVPATLEGSGTALLEIDGQHVGELISIPESAFSYDRWPGVQFARADLLRCALRLLNDGEVSLPGAASSDGVALCRLDELGQVGPDRRDVWDGFRSTDSTTAYPMVEKSQD